MAGTAHATCFPCRDHVHAVLRVAGSIRGDEDCFDLIVFDHLFQRRISFLTTTGLSQRGTAIREQITDGHDFYIGMILKTERGTKATNSVADNAHLEFCDLTPTSSPSLRRDP